MGTDQLLCQLITDHRSPPITDQSYDHRSPIIDHKPLNRFQTVVSITDHRSPMKHKSTHFMYQTAVESSITDRSTGSKQLKTNRSFNRFQTVEDQPFIQPVPNSRRPTAQSVPNS